jgi:hypothetical protein
LRESDLDPFTDVQVLPTPQILEQNIDMVHLMTSGSPRTEALSRTIIDQILIYCLYEQIQQSNQQPPKQATDTDKESHRSDQQSPKQATDTDKESHRFDQQSPKQTTDTEKDSSHMPPRTSDTDAEDPAVLELLHETCLSRVVTHKGETKRLYGFADYSIWYDSTKKGKEALATNLLIVEAKRRFYTDAALPQLASYMGIVHASRKDISKENCVVYGIASDGWTFRFCRIDNDGVFVSSDLLQWTRHKDRIYSIIRSLLQAAALSSPSTTPIKDPMRRKVVLASFGSPERTRRFDYGYGYGRFRIYEGDELENVEIVRFKPYWR